MSLGLTFRGRAPEPGRLQRLAEEMRFRLDEGPDGAWLAEFCPMGFVEFSIGAGGVCEGEATTTPAGPGFHKAVVDLLDALGVDEVEDETGYWESRDFAALQHAHFAWLEAARSGLAGYAQTHFLFSWPVCGWRPAGSDGIASPMGRFSHEPFRALPPDLFFLWWGPERDALYHRGMALYLIWNHVRWLPPRTEREQQVLDAVLRHLAAAAQRDPALPLPMAAWREVAGLAGADFPQSGPSLELPEGYGYLRHDIQLEFPGGWRVTLPGAFARDVEQDGYVYWDEERNFRLTAYRLDPSRGAYRPEKPEEPNLFAIDREENGLVYSGSARHISHEEGDHWALTGTVACREALAVITIVWTAPDWARWARETFCSVSRSS